jgi:hypothetical protein
MVGAFEIIQKVVDRPLQSPIGVSMPPPLVI